MKAWPIDPLDLRDLKLEVSEKLPTYVAALKPGVRPWLVSTAAQFSNAVTGNAPELRGYPKAQSYQAIGANLVVATIATVGMVTRLWDATMGNPPPSP